MIVGVLGGGQLAQMLAQAGQRLGLEFLFLCPNPTACAAPLGEHLCAAFDDKTALARLVERADVVTYEFENVPVAVVEWLAERVTVYPLPGALAVARDRLNEKRRFLALGIPTPEFAPVDSLADLEAAVARIGLPVVLKTRTQGYDGKGQSVVRRPLELVSAWEKMGGVPAIVESLVPFEREISIIAARSAGGELAFYPLNENHHRAGILRLSMSRAGDTLQGAAQGYIGRLLNDLDYVGVLALEMFVQGGQLLANEIAPRVHNSGHWTIEGSLTSQFENHLRAILDWPLGSTEITQPAAMVNLIGSLPAEADLRRIPGAFVHYYGKEPQPGRKLGHVTLLRTPQMHDEFAADLAKLLTLAGESELAGMAEMLSTFGEDQPRNQQRP